MNIQPLSAIGNSGACGLSWPFLAMRPKCQTRFDAHVPRFLAGADGAVGLVGDQVVEARLHRPAVVERRDEVGAEEAFAVVGAAAPEPQRARRRGSGSGRTPQYWSTD